MKSFDLAVLNNELMMDSRDIANVTGKKHTHVSRDISKCQRYLFVTTCIKKNNPQRASVTRTSGHGANFHSLRIGF